MTFDGAVAAEGCVLVVDDDEAIRDSLSELVELAGCEAICAANGVEALEHLSKRRPCLIIVDLLMPIMSGHELLEALRHEPALASLPVVISTSAPHQAPAGVPVIPKPINIASVLDWMRRSCRCKVPAFSP